MLGSRKISDTRHCSKVSLHPLPSFFSKNPPAKEGPDIVAPNVSVALAPTLDKSLKANRSLAHRYILAACHLAQ